MSEIFKPDANFKSGGVVGGYSSADAIDATSPTKIVLRINPTTKRLLVDVNGATTVTDGEAVDVTDVGTLVLGTDGSNYQVLSTNSSGRLQVDIVSGGGGGTQYAEDAAHSSGDTGTLALVVRKDTATQLAGTDGDYSTLITDANGRLHVLFGNTTIATTNAGTFVVQENGSALTALQLIDNIVTTEDTASANGDSGIVAFARRTLTPANTSGADGDYEAFQISAGRLWVSATVDAALPAGSNVIGALTANQSVNVAQMNGVTVTMGNGASGTGVQRITLASDSTGNIATIGTSVTPGTAAANLGKAEDAIHSTGDTGVFVLGVGNVAQTTLAADGDYIALAVDTKGNLLNTGNIAHDGVDAGNPIKIGYKAVASPKGLTLVAASDRTDAIADVDGIGISKLDTANDDVISERVADTAGTSAAFTNFGAVASTHNCVRTIVIWNSSATNGYVDFRDGTAGSILWTMPAPATGGSILPPTSPFAFRTSQNTALAYDVSGALSTVYISVSGYQSKS